MMVIPKTTLESVMKIFDDGKYLCGQPRFMQGTREMTAIGVRVLKKMRESFEKLQCEDQIYKKKHKTLFKLRCSYLQCI